MNNVQNILIRIRNSIINLQVKIGTEFYTMQCCINNARVLKMQIIGKLIAATGTWPSYFFVPSTS